MIRASRQEQPRDQARQIKSAGKGWRGQWGWVVAAIAVVLLLLLISAPTLQDGSTYSRSRKGYRQWYDYMLQQGYPIERWQQPYAKLQGQNQTLIRIAPQLKEGLDSTGVIKWQSLASWVKAGNQLIILTWQGKVTAAPFLQDLLSPKGAVRVETSRRHALQTGESARLQDVNGVVVWQQSLGKGQVILATYPWLGANIYADRPGNFAFLAGLIPKSQKILIDEWIHGYRPSPSQAKKQDYDSPEVEEPNLFTYFARTPLAAIAAQLLLLSLVWVWSENHRFGAALSVKAAKKDNSTEYIQALAGTLNYAEQQGFVLTELSTHLRHILATRLGLTALSATANIPADSVLAAHWAKATRREARELLELLQQAQRPRSGQDLLTWTSQIETLLQELP
ncbi:MAG: DUF4350 domain-containing protein [Acaryochloridaceae cyanobacterium SU_2_1]|nr:DUF4350 domain-containing protein [Acaryochloridaceae cyanobacterium SU_2_1]NJM95670.1 DUF4350 domain-containing protein [Acaryochloridaceae cyanobacterium CSU_5_19]